MEKFTSMMSRAAAFRKAKSNWPVRRPHLLPTRCQQLSILFCLCRVDSATEDWDFSPLDSYCVPVYFLYRKKVEAMATGGNISSTPDLQSILATLAQHAPTAAHFASAPPGNQGTLMPSGPDCDGRDTTLQDSLNAVRRSRLNAAVKPQGRSDQTPLKPMIDPCTITAWPDALRCVTKIAAQNAQFAANIKKVSSPHFAVRDA